MIRRLEYRGVLKKNISEDRLKELLAAARTKVSKAVCEEKLVELCLYRHNNMLFLYIEALDEVEPSELLSDMSQVLELWPEENGLTPWAYMYPIYYQRNPESLEEWVKERVPGKTKIGRIAFLKHETMFNYVYWHKAITDEGLLKGDKYQYISLHEDILFSYYEEPRNNVNISGREEESECIKGWLNIDPGSHFDQTKTKGQHFLVIEPILIVER